MKNTDGLNINIINLVKMDFKISNLKENCFYEVNNLTKYVDVYFDGFDEVNLTENENIFSLINEKMNGENVDFKSTIKKLIRRESLKFLIKTTGYNTFYSF